VAIPIANVEEACCDNDLSQFTIIDGDALDEIGSTCDKIIECTDKYILVEEKSIILAFLNNCCKEADINIDNDYNFINNYKSIHNGIEYINISTIVDEIIHHMNADVKKRILSDTVVDMISTSAKKASNTTDILNKQFNNTKTSDMRMFYLYCNSGKPIDRIMSIWLSRYKKNIFIECNAFKNYLQQRPC
jgi:hypothetical protein